MFAPEVRLSLMSLHNQHAETGKLSVRFGDVPYIIPFPLDLSSRYFCQNSLCKCKVTPTMSVYCCNSIGLPLPSKLLMRFFGQLGRSLPVIDKTRIDFWGAADVNLCSKLVSCD